MSYVVQWTVLKSDEEAKTKAILFDDGTTTPTIDINSISITAFDDAGTNVTSTIIDGTGTTIYSGNILKIRLRAGTSGESYLIKAQVTLSSSGDIMASYGVLRVYDPVDA